MSNLWGAVLGGVVGTAKVSQPTLAEPTAPPNTAPQGLDAACDCDFPVRGPKHCCGSSSVSHVGCPLVVAHDERVQRRPVGDPPDEHQETAA